MKLIDGLYENSEDLPWVLEVPRITNLAFFVPHLGCNNNCAFCNQKLISGKINPINAVELEKTIREQIPFLSEKGYKAEIAFFGGSFTLIPQEHMISLLMVANKYLIKYPKIFKGIRCSTRPDGINSKVLSILKHYGVTSIELGAQSMSDEVLKLNNRGHSADDVREASAMIQDFNFILGLQMMTGLYGDTLNLSNETAKEFIKLKPNNVRIYPTVIMKNTHLGNLYLKGEYKTFGFFETVDLCANLYEMFLNAGIRVIRIGLNASIDIENNMLGGNYHPAFGELSIGRYFGKRILLNMQKIGGNSFNIYTDKKYISKINGHKNANRQMLFDYGYIYKIFEKQGIFPLVKKGD